MGSKGCSTHIIWSRIDSMTRKRAGLFEANISGSWAESEMTDDQASEFLGLMEEVMTREARRLRQQLGGAPCGPQETLAEAIGCSPRSVRNWLSGRVQLSKKKARRIAEILTGDVLFFKDPCYHHKARMLTLSCYNVLERIDAGSYWLLAHTLANDLVAKNLIGSAARANFERAFYCTLQKSEAKVSLQPGPLLRIQRAANLKENAA